MASSSLAKMSVPPPGSDATGGQALLMPKLQYRFRVVFVGMGASGDPLDVTRQVVDCTRPSVEFTEIPLEIYNSRVYLAGKPTWQPITVNIRDDVSNKVSSVVGSQIQKQFDFQEQASAAAGNNYKFTMKIQVLDGGNGADGVQVLESWNLYGCYISTANYNTLNYGTNEAVTVALTIRYDNAEQGTGDGGDSTLVGGVGYNVGRALGDTATSP